MMFMDQGPNSAKTLTGDSPTVPQFWQLYLGVMGLQHSSDKSLTGKGARSRWVKEFAYCFDGKLQTEASTSQFFGLERPLEVQGDITAEKNVILVEVAIEQAWVKTYEDRLRRSQGSQGAGNRIEPPYAKRMGGVQRREIKDGN